MSTDQRRSVMDSEVNSTKPAILYCPGLVDPGISTRETRPITDPRKQGEVYRRRPRPYRFYRRNKWTDLRYDPRSHRSSRKRDERGIERRGGGGGGWSERGLLIEPEGVSYPQNPIKLNNVPPTESSPVPPSVTRRLLIRTSTIS